VCLFVCVLKEETESIHLKMPNILMEINSSFKGFLRVFECDNMKS